MRKLLLPDSHFVPFLNGCRTARASHERAGEPRLPTGGIGSASSRREIREWRPRLQTPTSAQDYRPADIYCAAVLDVLGRTVYDTSRGRRPPALSPNSSGPAPGPKLDPALAPASGTEGAASIQ
jgi:hypothetical protein